MDGYKEFTLRNGLRVHLQSTATPTAFGRLRVSHGALHELPGEEGSAHILEHLLVTGGSEAASPEETEQRVAALGYFNAFTTQEDTTFESSFLSEDAPDFLPLVAGMAFRPRLDSEKLEQERRRVLREIADRKSKESFVPSQAFHQALFGKGPRTYFVPGTESSVAAATQKSLRDFHLRGYSPNNADLILVGGLPGDIEQRIEESFGALPTGSGHPYNFPAIQPLRGPSVLRFPSTDLHNHDLPDQSSAAVVIGMHAPPDGAEEAVAVSVLNYVLGDGMHSRLFRRLSTGEGLAYGIESEYNRILDAGILQIETKVPSRMQERALDNIFEELGRLKESGIDEAELAQAKHAAKYAFANQLETNRGKSNAILRKIDYGIEPSTILRQLDVMTPKKVSDAAAHYLPKDRQGGYVALILDPLLSQK